MKTLIICRFFSGLGGAGSIALAPGLIADLYPAENRGFGATVVGMGGLAGPVLGPVLGGFIGQQLGWRWEFWLLLIQSAIYAAALTILNVETYGPVLIRRKIRTLEIELLRDDLRSAYDLDKPPRKRGSVLLHGLTVPFVLLTRSLVIGIMSISTALIFGLLYLFFLTIPSVFENDYGFTASKTGLANLGLCLGSILTMFLHALTSDAWLRRLALKYNGGVPTPEMRLPLLTIYTLIMPVSFFWYGWAVDTRMSYIWPIVSTVPFAISSTGMFMVIVAYVIDSFPEHAASASAAITFARSMVGAVLPLAGPAMFKRLGLGWGNSVLGFLSLLFVPIPFVFYRYGERMREVSPVL
ncbi:hypothetical protein KEM55_008183 [Ascosphaera atra]|nr:hypothetical protein KEM55_008183 [Ascosphaera atra]